MITRFIGSLLLTVAIVQSVPADDTQVQDIIRRVLKAEGVAWETDGSTATNAPEPNVDNRPVVRYYTAWTEKDGYTNPQTWCRYCNDQAKSLGVWLKTHSEADLPVRLELQGATGPVPRFEWEDAAGKTWKIEGARPVDTLLYSWTKTLGQPTKPETAESAPTPYEDVTRGLALLKPQANETLVDYGCGDGRWLIAAVRGYGCKAVGIEIDPEKAEEARRQVQTAGLQDRIQIIEGDATKIDVKADIGVAYLYGDTLKSLAPKLKKLKRFVSYMHPAEGTGLVQSQSGSFYAYSQPAPQRQMIYHPPTISHPICGNRGCAMCYGYYSYQ